MRSSATKIMETYDFVVSFIERVKDDLLASLPKIVEKIADYTGTRLSEEDIHNAFMMEFEDTLHVFIHELAHVVIEKEIPWTKTLNEFDHVFVDEVLARFVERFVSSKLKDELKLKELKIVVESFEKQIEELKGYPQLMNIKLSVEDYSLLYEDFQKHMDGKGSLEDFGRRLLKILHSFGSQ